MRDIPLNPLSVFFSSLPLPGMTKSCVPVAQDNQRTLLGNQIESMFFVVFFTSYIYPRSAQHKVPVAQWLTTVPLYSGGREPGLTLKPIFHCDAKPFALGTFASPNAKDGTLLVSLALDYANFSRHLMQNPQRESVECRLRWVPNAKFLHWPCTFHFFGVDFIHVG